MMPRVQNCPFAGVSRASLLAEHTNALERVLQLPDDDDAYEAANQKLWEIRQAYCDQLPLVRFCASPFDGLPFDHSIDLDGLDGLWWSAIEPLRPLEFLPRHVVAFTGAMTLVEPLENTVFLVKPGPGAPFVVPWLLELPGVKAVLCPLMIGRHQGWPVIYFREDLDSREGGFNTWGQGLSRFVVDEETSGWHEWSAGPEDYDFDLAPWVKSGKLLWLPEDDPTGVPRNGLEGFEWLNLPGERKLHLVCQGRVILQEPFAPVGWDEDEEAKPESVGREEQWWQAPIPEPKWQPEAPEPESEPEREPELKPEPEPKEEAPPMPSSEPTPEQRAPAAPPPVQASAPPVQLGPKFCRQCGKPLKTGAKFCGGCGAKL